MQAQKTKTIGSTSIIHWTDTLASDRYVIEVKSKAFVMLGECVCVDGVGCGGVGDGGGWGGEEGVLFVV